MAHILKLASDLTDISLQNGLNEHEFLWYPYFRTPYGDDMKII
jgi:hypothetical protein